MTLTVSGIIVADRSRDEILPGLESQPGWIAGRHLRGVVMDESQMRRVGTGVTADDRSVPSPDDNDAALGFVSRCRCPEGLRSSAMRSLFPL